MRVTARARPRVLVKALVALAVALLSATLFFVDTAVRSVTRLALAPVQVEMRAISTSLDTNLSQVGNHLASVPGVRRVEETVHFLEQIYGREVSQDNTVTVVRFSAILERPEEISGRLQPGAPSQN